MPDLPSISVITCTYGRTTFLSQAIAMFLTQDYVGEHEMVILNSCPKQTLVFDPRVTIINLDERPQSLGECRNKAISECVGPVNPFTDHIILQLDDDDSILPHHLSTVAKHFDKSLSWIWLDTMFHSEKGQIQKIVKGNISCLAYTKDAWLQVGGFNSETVGEDRSFLGKLSAQCKGKIVQIAPQEIGFIYGWDNNAPHISGLGTDDQRKPSANVWAEQELAKRIKSGSEPTGTIILKPHCNVDWKSQAESFVAKNFQQASVKRDAVCIVLLGRHGDIINCLPVAKHIHDSYSKPVWMVSAEFAGTLDGVSYVEPYVVNLNNNQLSDALTIARREFKHVLCAQIHGKNFAQPRNTPAYNMESWRNCGFLHKFRDKTWLPHFDRRDAQREADLVNHATGGGKHKIILVQTSSSISSPFGFGKSIANLIKSSFSDRFQIIDLADLKAHRIYDLIGLMDAAECLVSLDSAPLHLAAASKIPVVALVNPLPWLGTATRCNCVSRFTYAQAEKEPHKLIGSVEKALASSFADDPVFNAPAEAPKRRTIHAVAPFKRKNEREQKRVDEAQKSWEYLLNICHVLPLVPKDFRASQWRLASEDIGDPRALPYLKDLLQVAMNVAQNDDIIMFTNDDVWLHPELPDLIRFHVSLYGVCTSRRCELKEMLPENSTPEQFAAASQGHCGRDLFAATKAWLVEHWDSIPDFILGSSKFDLVLAYIVRDYFGITPQDIGSMDVDAFPAEIKTGYVVHQRHENTWSKPENYNSPSETHNRKLYDDFVSAYDQRVAKVKK